MSKRFVVSNAGFASLTEPSQERLLWLRRVRWAALIGHAFVFIGARYGIGLFLEWPPFLLVEAILFITNLSLYTKFSYSSARKDNFLGLVVCFDVLLFTYLLFSYGGHANPFSMFYLVHVVLAALLISQLWSWIVTALSSACFASLFIWQDHASSHAMHHSHFGEFDMHLNGMLGAFVLISILIAAFVTRMRSAIDRQELQLLKLRTNEDKLLSLTTLAAGAAHELNTPLSTMSVVLGDLKDIVHRGDKDELEEELTLLRGELNRCSNILRKMSPDSGELNGEMPENFFLAELVDVIKDSLPQEIQETLIIENVLSDMSVNLPKNGLVQVLVLLIKNAYDATMQVSQTRSDGIKLSIEVDQSNLLIQIKDHGIGMQPEILKRIGEPFFTTKLPGKGVGLGVFLSGMLISRLGGELSFESIPHSSQVDSGTTVMVKIPIVESWQKAA